MTMTLQRETASQIPVRFLVGDTVEVLSACHLPKFERGIGTGVIERITHQTSDGTSLYWIAGFPCARTARVLRLVVRGPRS